MAAKLAAEEVKALSRPQTPDAYKVELPADFKPPAGVEFKFNEADPLLGQAKSLAVELGIPQEGFSKLLALYAGSQVASEQMIQSARQAEVAKLGANGTARIGALDTFFKAYLGPAEGAQLLSRVATASDVQILERLVGKVTSQGAASFSASGREPPQPSGRVSDEAYAKMGPAQRLDYARQFDQKQFLNGSGR